MDLASVIENLRNEADRVGYGPAFGRLAYDVANRVLVLRRLDMIVLKREHLRPLDPERYASYASRLATKDDLMSMRSEGGWQLTDELMAGFHDGDSCVLSTIEDRIAGYTWVHTQGRPLLLPGLRISIPRGYAYNFAGFTHPEFRGCGLQSFRHHAVLHGPEWNDYVGMIGYVEATNFSSKKGQSKSGYQPLGTLTLVGSKERFVTHLSDELKRMGIRRL